MTGIVGGLLAACVVAGPAREPALKRSDVVFMYQATPAVYAEYGATVLGWGGTPTREALADARGVRFFGSVGMVTEFAAFVERFPRTWAASRCLDIDGKPVKVPWLVDLKHKGEPYWWCCTRQPDFRTYLRERVTETMRAGAAGLHIDDHLGTAGGLWLGICFCDRCVAGFPDYLRTVPPAELETAGVREPAAYDFRAAVRAWMAQRESRPAVTDHPLWPRYTAYQLHGAADLMAELRDLARQVAGRPVPVGANAGLLWGNHLATYRAVDLFSAETEHHAAGLKVTDGPVLAYRLAEAVCRPYAATAAGGDWAFIKAQNKPGLVRSWIALAYASGQLFMAPHHQWCHTPELGTHWYDGPAERFAPLYRFVRQRRDLFDGYETYADLALVMPHRSFLALSPAWRYLNAQLCGANVSYRLVLGGDDIIDCALAPDGLAKHSTVLSPYDRMSSSEDRKRIDARRKRPGVVATIDAALARVRPAVNVETGGQVRAMPRVGPRGAVVHLLNGAYDAATDDVREVKAVRVTLDRRALGVAGATSCRLARPDGPDVPLAFHGDTVTVPSLGLWGLLVVEKPHR